MKRSLYLGLLVLLIGIFAGNTSVVGEDKVDRRDKKSEKTVTVSGKLVEESAAGIKMKVGAKEELVPASEIVRVYYDDIPVQYKQAFSNLFNTEEKEKDVAKIHKDYRDLNAKITVGNDVKPAVKRYVAFRVAMTQLAAADSKAAKEDAQRELENFVEKNAGSWEYAFAARNVARMQLDQSNYTKAVKTIQDLAGNASVPADIRQEAETMLVDVMFQAKQIEPLRTKIDAALADAKTTPEQKARLQVYQIGLDAQGADAKIEDVVKRLDDLIAKTIDPNLKALAYNIMGDCYMSKQHKRDAMWSYLWVDAVYTQDKMEHLKAMTKLLAIFKEEKDLEKIRFYEEKMARFR